MNLKMDMDLEMTSNGSSAGLPGWLTPSVVSKKQKQLEAPSSPIAEAELDLVMQLRALLCLHLAGMGVARAAERLGTSTRSLQRHLAARGTSFQRELDAIRLREAESQLLAGVRPITQIAMNIGFASSQSFWRHFRKIKGLSPSAWRREYALGALESQSVSVLLIGIVE